MQTSGLLSSVPPNQAASIPSFVSTIVEAWQDGKEAVSLINSEVSNLAVIFLDADCASKAKRIRAKINGRQSWFKFFISLIFYDLEQKLGRIKILQVEENL
jgi:hypothetical protein